MKHTALLAAAVVTAALSAALTAPGAAAAPPGPEGPTNEALANAGSELQRSLQETPRYAGLQAAPDHSKIQIWSTDVHDRDLNERVQAHRQGVPFEILPAEHSYADLASVRDRMDSDIVSMRGEGVYVVFWGPDPVTNSVTVGVANPPADAEQRLKNRYGPLVRVVAAAPALPASSRLNDTSPWNTGDAITFDNGHYCSSGPAVKTSTGKTYLLTAGHCVLDTAASWTGNYIYRTFNGSPVIAGGSGTQMGNMAAELDSSGYDAALIDTSASGLGFRTAGTNDTGTAVAQKQEFASTVNTSVCASGAYSGERCAAVVSQADVSTAGADGYTRIHSVVATNATTDVAGSGDSGGPVYTVQSTGLFMTGLIWGVGNTVTCSRNAITGRVCGRTVYYQNLSSVMNHRGVSLLTR